MESILLAFLLGAMLAPISPCGQCIGCRIDRSRQWAARCVHEAQLHTDNCFLTLTYADEHLPKHNSVSVKELQLFMRYLRRAIYPTKVRFFACGEYGDQFNRPHYHIALFGYDFPDKELFTKRRANNLYISETLNKIWGKGHCSIGELNYQSAAYIARYVVKKINGDRAFEHL